jgi:hypothetical protein
VVVASASAVVAALVAMAPSSASASSARGCVAGTSCAPFALTVGVNDPSEPSNVAPPAATALTGYQQTYVTDFPGSSLPGGWSTFAGAPGGDPGTRWTASQVVVGSGELQLNASYDSNLKEWITGGTCDCGRSQTYGAYFVRSRMTGPGPTVVELLWPASGYPWPPEIDFNETYGPTTSSMATVHFGASNSTEHHSTTIDMTQWHTWGVVWSPTTITYVVDGAAWAVVNAANEIPSQPMTLDIQQQTWCSSGFACPTAPQSTLVDWAAVYSPTSGSPPAPTTTTTTTAPPAPPRPPSRVVTKIPIDANLPAARLSAAVQSAALTIFRHHAHTVTVKATVAVHHRASVSPAIRVQQIDWMLAQDIRNLGRRAPRIFVRWVQSAKAVGLPLKLLLTVSA